MCDSRIGFGSPMTNNPTGIRDHLKQIISSPGFQNSERLCRFLSFTVEATLRGESGQIKEYSIGREVFDRTDEYDPRLDPIVRVEARRLRKRLDEYYASHPGEAGDVRIDFPKGSYVPEFREVHAELPVRAAARSRMPMYLAAATAFALLFVVAAWIIWPSKNGPGSLIAVVPARWVWPGNDFPSVTYDEELAEQVAADLVRDKAAEVVAWPLLQRFRDNVAGATSMAEELHVNKLYVIAVRLDSSGFRVTGFMLEPKSGRKLGVYDGSTLSLETPELRLAAAKKLAAAVKTFR